MHSRVHIKQGSRGYTDVTKNVTKKVLDIYFNVMWRNVFFHEIDLSR